MLVPCKYHFRGHCKNKTSCKFDHNIRNCHRGLHCPMKGDQCKLRHVKTCRNFLSGSCGFINKEGKWMEYPTCSYNHPPVIQRWKKCDNLATINKAKITKKNLSRNDKDLSEKIKILTINDSIKEEGKKGERDQTLNRSKTNLLVIALLTAVLMIRAELINKEDRAVGSSGRVNLLTTVLLIVLILVERTGQIISFLSKMRISLGKALAEDVQEKIEKRIISLQAKLRVVKTLHDEIKKLEGKVAKLQKCRTEAGHGVGNDKITKQRQRQLIRRPDGTNVCRNCYGAPCLHGKQVTWKTLTQQLSPLITNATRTRVQGQFNGSPLKDVIVSGIKGHIWSYEIFNVWLKNQDAIVDLDKIKTLKYNCLE